MRAKRFEIQRIGHRALGDQVAPANFYLVDADLRSDRIEQPLTDKGALVTTWRAIGAARRFVRQPDMTAGAVGRQSVWAWKHRGGKIRDRRSMRAHIGAIIVEELVIDGENAALVIDRSANFVCLLARVVGRDQVLAAILDPLDRLTELQRCRTDQKVFGIESRHECRNRRRRGLRTAALISALRPSIKAMRSRFQCGTLAAPYNSSVSPSSL